MQNTSEEATPAAQGGVASLDRHNPDVAEKIIEHLLPDAETRSAVLRLLADLILVANEKPDAWGVTLQRDSVALNVGGGYYAFYLRPKGLYLVWRQEAAPPWEGAKKAYDRFPDALTMTVLPGEWVPRFGEYRTYIENFVRRANLGSQSALLPAQRQAHSPGVLRYLESKLQEKLPAPQYPAITPPDPPPPLPKFPLNTILYGPPGTGKTYETARRAVQIIDGKAYSDRGELMRRYRKLQRTGRIGFVTFHQSYSYEDFVEGIRPVMGDDAAGATTPRYQIADGILKRMALEALAASPHRLPESDTNVGEGEHETLERFLEIFHKQVTEEPYRKYDIGSKAKNKDYIFAIGKAGEIRYTTLERGQPVPTDMEYEFLSSARIKAIWNQYQDKPKINSTDVYKVIEQSRPVYAVVINEVKRIRAEREKSPSRMEASSEANDEATAGDTPRYILIVDEINRGNVSKILGELITLLEDDKRVGEDNALTVTLPYSREPFSLPPNLYLIGTMNTADKSLALLDIALRRRFAFEELTPDFEKCDPTLTAEMKLILNELNRRITLRKDRDHRIGHAFFMGIEADTEAFNEVFTRKIIPLLQEYFFNDWAGLLYVLSEPPNGGGFIVPIPGAEADGQRNRWQWRSDAGASAGFSPYLRLLQNYNSMINTVEVEMANADGGNGA